MESTTQTTYGILSYSGDSSPEAFAREFAEAVKRHKVLRITGLNGDGDQRDFYDALTEAAGECYHLAEDAKTNSRNGQKWFEIRFDPSIPNAYRHSREGQPLHTDGSYIQDSPAVTFMYCVNSAPKGGETIFLDGDDLVDLLKTHDSELLSDLESTRVRFAKVGDERTEPIISRDEGGYLINWNYYCVAPDQGEEIESLKKRFFAFQKEVIQSSDRLIPVGLKPGEAVAFQDRRVLHGRNAFEAFEVSDRFLWKAFLDPR